MKRTLRGASALLVLCGGSLCLGQSDFSKQTVQAIHVEGWGLDEMMHQVADKTHLAIGVELDVVVAKAGHFELDFPGGTVSDLASKCAALMHGASWRIVNNRSLFIYLPGKATSLSEQRIQYPGMSQARRQQVWEDLSNRPEIDNWMQKSGCKRQDIFIGDFWRGDKPTISIPAGTITLGDMIEMASSQSTRHFWSIVNDSNNGACLIAISF
jgi:hypothetical protein